jgi:hypothetical protein
LPGGAPHSVFYSNTFPDAGSQASAKHTSAGQVPRGGNGGPGAVQDVRIFTIDNRHMELFLDQVTL